MYKATAKVAKTQLDRAKVSGEGLLCDVHFNNGVKIEVYLVPTGRGYSVKPVFYRKGVKDEADDSITVALRQRMSFTFKGEWYVIDLDFA